MLRCARRSEGAFEIASWRGVGSLIESKFTTHFMATPVNIELDPKATKRKITRRSYMNQRVEAPLRKLKSILSSCWQAPAVSNQPGTCTIKNHLPKHISRHASSLAVPPEDSMCGDGPTTQTMESFLQDSSPAHISRHASSLAVP